MGSAVGATQQHDSERQHHCFHTQRDEQVDAFVRLAEANGLETADVGVVGVSSRCAGD